MAVPATLTDVQRAARFWYLQKLAFGGRAASQTFGTTTTNGARMNLLRIEEDLSQAHLRLAGATIENLPWRACIERYDRAHTLFYLDPPYWQTEGYGVPFPWPEYEALAESMLLMKGKAVLSINDHPDIRKLFKGFRTDRVSITYHVSSATETRAAELIIRSW